MGSSFGEKDGKEEKSIAFHPLQSSERWGINLCWNGDYSSSRFFCYIQSHKFNSSPYYFFSDSEQEWSLSDYKRRVSSTATVEAAYFTTTIRRAASPARRLNTRFTIDIFGLAAGGQMYGPCDFRLLIISLISLTECGIYTVT